MMVQFRIDNFKFDGKYLSDFGFRVVSVDKSNNRKIGLARSLETVEGINGNKSISKINPTVQTFTITITKTNLYNMLSEITDDDLEQLTTWLFMNDNYKEFIPLSEGTINRENAMLLAINDGLLNTEQNDYIAISLFSGQPKEDIMYYGMFIDGEQVYNEYNKGYINLTFEIDSNHAYLSESINTYQVNGEKTITIESKGNIEEYCYPDIEFNVNGVSFTIENLTTGDKIQFSNLDSKSRNGIIYGDGIMTVISKTDATVNMREKSNKKFLRLKHGTNQIKIIGDGTFTISFQPRISLR